jgi:hypothetical protein
MEIVMPAETTDFIWEGKMEPIPDSSTRRRSRPDAADSRPDEDLPEEELPTVSIGRPVLWSLLELFDTEEVPRSIRAKLDLADFHLVQLNCSFRPSSKRIRIEWARFWAYFPPDAQGHQPAVFDLYPKLVTEESEREVNVSLSPSLRFSEAEVGLGTLGFNLKYTKYHATVTAAGVGEDTADWSYEVGRGVDIRGSVWMYALLQTPKEMTEAHVQIGLLADVATARGFVPLGVLDMQDRKQLRVSSQLWP